MDGLRDGDFRFCSGATVQKPNWKKLIKKETDVSCHINSASEMTYIVSAGALNSTHSLLSHYKCSSYFKFKRNRNEIKSSLFQEVKYTSALIQICMESEHQ